MWYEWKTNDVSELVLGCDVQTYPITRCKLLDLFFLEFLGVDWANGVDNMASMGIGVENGTMHRVRVTVTYAGRLYPFVILAPPVSQPFRVRPGNHGQSDML